MQVMHRWRCWRWVTRKLREAVQVTVVVAKARGRTMLFVEGERAAVAMLSGQVVEATALVQGRQWCRTQVR